MLVFFTLPVILESGLVLGISCECVGLDVGLPSDILGYLFEAVYRICSQPRRESLPGGGTRGAVINCLLAYLIPTFFLHVVAFGVMIVLIRLHRCYRTMTL